jgi:hypothetical protein
MFTREIISHAQLKPPADPSCTSKSHMQSFSAAFDDKNFGPQELHPLVQVIEEFTNLRIASQAHNSGLPKARLEDFIARFECEMIATEALHRELLITES